MCFNDRLSSDTRRKIYVLRSLPELIIHKLQVDLSSEIIIKVSRQAITVIATSSELLTDSKFIHLHNVVTLKRS